MQNSFSWKEKWPKILGEVDEGLPYLDQWISSSMEVFSCISLHSQGLERFLDQDICRLNTYIKSLMNQYENGIKKILADKATLHSALVVMPDMLSLGCALPKLLKQIDNILTDQPMLGEDEKTALMQLRENLGSPLTGAHIKNILQLDLVKCWKEGCIVVDKIAAQSSTFNFWSTAPAFLKAVKKYAIEGGNYFSAPVGRPGYQKVSNKLKEFLENTQTKFLGHGWKCEVHDELWLKNMMLASDRNVSFILPLKIYDGDSECVYDSSPEGWQTFQEQYGLLEQKQEQVEEQKAFENSEPEVDASDDEDSSGVLNVDEILKERGNDEDESEILNVDEILKEKKNDELEVDASDDEDESDIFDVDKIIEETKKYHSDQLSIEENKLLESDMADINAEQPSDGVQIYTKNQHTRFTFLVVVKLFLSVFFNEKSLKAAVDIVKEYRLHRFDDPSLMKTSSYDTAVHSQEVRPMSVSKPSSNNSLTPEYNNFENGHSPKEEQDSNQLTC